MGCVGLAIMSSIDPLRSSNGEMIRILTSTASVGIKFVTTIRLGLEAIKKIVRAVTIFVRYEHQFDTSVGPESLHRLKILDTSSLGHQ